MLPVPEIAITFDLAHPFIFKSKEYTQISARRPKVKDLRILARSDERDPVGPYNDFLTQICTLEKGTIDELDLVDYGQIQEWVKDFLPRNDEPTS